MGDECSPVNCADATAKDDEWADISALPEWFPVRAHGPGPSQTSLHTAVVIGGSMYIFGGYDGTGRVNTLYAYGFDTNEWSEVQIPIWNGRPSARDRHVAIAWRGSMYVFGGFDGMQKINDLWEFDPRTARWLEIKSQGSVPSPRHSHCACCVKDKMYVFAGFDGSYRNDFYELDLIKRYWTLLSPSNSDIGPSPRYRATLAAWRDRLCLFGGHDGSAHLNDFFAYDLRTMKWQEIAFSQFTSPPPFPRDSHSATVVNDSLLVFGGSSSQRARNDLHEFRLERNEWVDLRHLLCRSFERLRHLESNVQPETSGMLSLFEEPHVRFCHTAVVHGSGIYIFGGYDGTTRLADFWCLQFPPTAAAGLTPHNSLQEYLKFVFSTEAFADVTFVVENERIPAHRLLVSRSPYFKALLYNGVMKESVGNDAIEVEGVSLSVFTAFLKFLYTDRLDLKCILSLEEDSKVKLRRLIELLVVADKYATDRLKRLCEKLILRLMDASNAPEIYQAADLHGAETLKSRCVDFMVRKFDVVSKTESFAEMARCSVDLLLELLQRR